MVFVVFSLRHFLISATAPLSMCICLRHVVDAPCWTRSILGWGGIVVSLVSLQCPRHVLHRDLPERQLRPFRH
ncbi:hypothetical protein EDB81DRAFT_775386 [Dactylonectria macrodidyma]|uniref:Uncharacterized protein n=1 Tax=Dactylonectria macrodidyma TaxID=307937 RepID=A0A9P9JP52_9HYPO|nr:hypothetical protein EDB81DRAFT_775386 [Dactylonectria macrodidyma]